MPTVNPAQAARLLLDPRRLRYACEYRSNPAFSRQAATTRDWQGDFLAAVITPRIVDDTTEWLAITVDMLLRGEHVDLDPVRLGRVPKRAGGTRDVWVMSYRRRALSNLIADVLTDATSHRLHRHVRAYIPGLTEAVKETVLDVAEAVQTGRVTKFVNEDVQNCFDALSFELVEDALRHYGFAPEVVSLVMTSVRAPRWVGPPDKGHLVTFDRGIPMGIGEAAVLANLAFYELDDSLASIPKLTVLRYSDNIFVGAAAAPTAVRAARVLQAWVRSRGLQLKGVHHKAGPQSLIRDVRNTRISFLGAEVDSNGEVRLPPRTSRAKLIELGEHVAAWDEHFLRFGSRFSGRSRYAGGVGISVMDLDDIQAQVVGFEEYWAQLNEVDAQRFRGVVERRHPGLLRLAEQPAAAWEASLGSQQMVESEDEPNHSSPSTFRSLSMPTALRANGRTGEGITTRVLARTVVDCDSANDHGVEATWEGNLYGADTTGTGSLPHGRPNGQTGRAGALEDEALYHQGIGLEHMEENEAPHAPIHPGRELISQVVASPLSRERTRARESMVAGPGRADPPSAPVLDNSLHVHATWSRSRDGVFGARVVTRYGAVGQEFVDLHPSVRVEVALVRAITQEVRLAAARGERHMTIHTDQWLPKHLLSRQRRFRSPVLFADVLTLHRVAESAGVAVRLVGEPTDAADCSFGRAGSTELPDLDQTLLPCLPTPAASER